MAAMLTRNYISTSRVAVLFFIVLLVFWFNAHSDYAPTSLIKATKGVDEGARIAIVTFTTNEKSYTYTSLKNKNGVCHTSAQQS